MSEIWINTRTLCGPTTGVQRYLEELLKRFPKEHIRLVRPRRCSQGLKGHVWEQGILPAYLRGERLLFSPSNTGPLSVRRQVVTVHDLATFDFPDGFNPAFLRWYRFLLPRLVRRVRRVIAVSNFTKNRLVDLFGVDPAKVAVVYNGVDIRFAPQPEPQIASALKALRFPSRKYILTVGSLVSRKNLNGLLEAWRRLLPSVPRDLWLVVAGDLGARRVFSSLALKELPERVFFAGRVADELLPAVYSGALAFAYVSFYEGFGLPPLEAMATGTPVVVSDRSAIPEVVGDAGILVDPSDADAIAQGLKRLLENENLRRSLAEKGIKRARGFTWDRTARQTWKVLSQAAREDGS